MEVDNWNPRDDATVNSEEVKWSPLLQTVAELMSNLDMRSLPTTNAVPQSRSRSLMVQICPSEC